MPAQRLPWFKFWIDATSNAKVRVLDDPTFRTWVELLDACARQSNRGRFASRAEAQAIVRRPAKHIATLIAGRLIDETPEGLTMHDWDEWQRWRPGDVNDSPTSTDQPPNDPGTTHERLRNDQWNDHSSRVRGAAPASGEERREKREEERDVEIPPATQPPLGGRRRVTEVTEEFRQALVDEYAQAFGSRGAVVDCINTAMSHRARLKCGDQQAYLRNWLRKDAPKMPPTPIRQNGRLTPLAIVEHPREPEEFEQPPPPRPQEACADCGTVTILWGTGPYCYPCKARRRKKAPA